MSRTKSHYDTLKVDRQAPAAVIKAAYKALVQIHHPDKNPDDAQAAATMHAVNQAYEELIDPERRKTYDAWLAGQEREAARAAEAAATRGAAAAAGAVRRRQAHTTGSVSGGARTAPASQGLSLETMGLSALLLAMFAGLVYGLLKEDKPAPAVSSRPPAASAVSARPGDSVVTDKLLQMQVGNQAAPAANNNGPYARPATAPNGRPWPLGPDYLTEMPKRAEGGRSRVSLNNTGTGSDVYVRLVNAGDGQELRYVYVPLYDRFTLNDIAPGTYLIKFTTLDDGQIYKTGEFTLSEQDVDGLSSFSDLTISLEHGGRVSVEGSTPIAGH